MASKPLIIASLVGASVGVPYFVSRTNSGDGGAAIQPAPPVSGSVAAVSAPPLPGPPSPPAVSVIPSARSTSGAAAVPPSPSAEQALQFNVTKDWVYRSWDRKSTGPTDVGLFAIRVPLVSGTQSASLAGSLTYYFNTQDEVEHISFRGRTGDPSRLVRFLMQNYQFQPQGSQPGEQVYQVADRGGVRSELRTRPAPIVATASPHGLHSVELELARPGSGRYLPPRGPFISVPQATDAGQPASNLDSTSSTASQSAPSGNYFDDVRYATPQEESQAFWKRWPN